MSGDHIGRRPENSDRDVTLVLRHDDDVTDAVADLDGKLGERRRAGEVENRIRRERVTVAAGDQRQPALRAERANTAVLTPRSVPVDFESVEVRLVCVQELTESRRMQVLADAGEIPERMIEDHQNVRFAEIFE